MKHYQLFASPIHPMLYLYVSDRKIRKPRGLVPCGKQYIGKNREASTFLPDCKIVRV